jgi:MFS family permease
MNETGTRAEKAKRATRRVFAASQSAARASASAATGTARASATAASGASRLVHLMTGASGASRTGLANLIELTAAGNVGDAFVIVALAGTLFFNTSLDQARSQVVLYLLVTMAPFVVLAPFIGPMLDRVQQGRRFILAGTLLARGLLCWGMSGALHNALTLFPAAFGVLILQKAYGVTRSAVTPRLLPAELTLVSANARSSLIALLASTLGVGLAGGIEWLGGAAWVLRIGALIYIAGTVLGIRLPESVDTPDPPAAVAYPARPGDPARDGDPGRPGAAAGPGAPGRPGGSPGRPGGSPGRPGAAAGPGAPPGRPGGSPGRPGAAAGPGAPGRPGGTPGRPGGPAPTRPFRTRERGGGLRTLRSVGPVVGEAMRGNATLRAFSGFMLFFLAFLLREYHFRGMSHNVALAALGGAVAAGGFIGTAIGSKLRSRRPHLIVLGMLAVATIVTATCAWFFGLWAALVVAFVAATAQALVKLALDSTVQHEIGEDIRSSTFAVSETLNQLSWVIGGLAGVALSLTSSGVAGLSVAAVGLAVALVLLVAGRRRRVLEARQMAQETPGLRALGG